VQGEKSEFAARDMTEVSLVVEFAFKNPLYGVMASAATEKVAGIMIEAFEVRARYLLDGPGKKEDVGDEAMGRRAKMGM